MSRIRFTLAQLMGVVVFIGFGLTALRNANEFWASATYTLAFLLISGAPVGALARKGNARVVWAGVAAFGWARVVVGALPYIHLHDFGPTEPPILLTESGLDYVRQYISPSLSTDHAKVSYSLEIIFLGIAGSLVGQLFAGKHEQPNV
jgi:hypothetical protein